jgi:hypothetical protein
VVVKEDLVSYSEDPDETVRILLREGGELGRNLAFAFSVQALNFWTG